MHVSAYMAQQWICEWLIIPATIYAVAWEPPLWGHPPSATSILTGWLIHGSASPPQPRCGHGATRGRMEVGSVRPAARPAPVSRAACNG